MTEDSHELDCADVIDAVYLYIDGELEHEAIDDIRNHLEECTPCLREYGVEREVKQLIARSCKETAPDSLRESVIARLEVVRTELTIDDTVVSRTQVRRVTELVDPDA